MKLTIDIDITINREGTTRGGTTGDDGLYKLVLDDTGTKKIQVIKELRPMLGLSLEGAKKLAESAPTVIDRDRNRDRLERMMVTLQDVGASAYIHTTGKV